MKSGNPMEDYQYSKGDIFDALTYARGKPLGKNERAFSSIHFQSALREIARVRTKSLHVPASAAEGMSMEHGGESE